MANSRLGGVSEIWRHHGQWPDDVAACLGWTPERIQLIGKPLHGIGAVGTFQPLAGLPTARATSTRQSGHGTVVSERRTFIRATGACRFR